MGKIIDLTNQKFGRLTVIEKAEKPVGSHSTSIFWKCRCDCGTEKIISGNVLRQGKAKSCGCYNKEYHAANYIDLTGKKFGKLEVLTKVPKPEHLKSPGTYWLCRCTCGKEKIIYGKSLLEGHTTSCGSCRTDIIDDLTGKKFGHLTVIERDYSRPSNNNGAFWKCRCDCGNIITVLGKNLKHDNCYSCGCIISIGEQKIQDILEKNNITFSKQYTFSDLLSEKGNKLRFDFAIFQDNQLSRLIEFQGEQHYEPNSILWSENTIIHDNLKRNYCNKHNITLVEIPYWKRNNLTINDIMGNQYVINERAEVEE